MENDYFINRMNISHYRALLQTNLDENKREMIHHLIAELEMHLASQQRSSPR